MLFFEWKDLLLHGKVLICNIFLPEIYGIIFKYNAVPEGYIRLIFPGRRDEPWTGNALPAIGTERPGGHRMHGTMQGLWKREISGLPSPLRSPSLIRRNRLSMFSISGMAGVLKRTAKMWGSSISVDCFTNSRQAESITPSPLKSPDMPMASSGSSSVVAPVTGAEEVLVQQRLR